MELSKHICPVCFKAFKRSTILRDHLLAHAGTKAHECGTCRRAFTRSKDLKSHEQTHRPSVPYKCGGCGVGFRRKRDVLRHQQRKKGLRCRNSTTVSIRTNEEVDAAGTLAEMNLENLEYHDKAADRHIEQTMVRQQEMQYKLQPAPRPLATSIDQKIGAAAFTLAAVLHKQAPAYRTSDRSQTPSTQADDDMSSIEDTPELQCEQYTCPLNTLPDMWADGSPDSDLLQLPCHYYVQSDLPSLRTHLRLVHNVHSFCEICVEGLAADYMLAYSSDLFIKCNKVGCPSKTAVGCLVGVVWLKLRSEKSKFAVTKPFALLSRSSTELSGLYQASGVAEPSYAEKGLYASSVPASAVELNQNRSSSRSSPASERPYANDQDLGIAIAAMGPNEHDLRLAPPVSPIDVNASTIPGSSLQRRLAPNDQHRHVTLQQPTPTNVPALHRELDSFVHDDISNPRPELLKVVIDVTKYLRGLPQATFPFGLSYCETQVLKLLVARSYEASDTDLRVATAERDKLWAACTRHYGSTWWCTQVDYHHPFSKDLDQILRPLLNTRTHGVLSSAVTAWVANSRQAMKQRCLGKVCSCEKYLEALHPYSECVTALFDWKGTPSSSLICREGDQIRLISHDPDDYWKGKCIRTGTTGLFHWRLCA